MRPVRVKSWPGVKRQRPPPSVPEADTDPELWVQERHRTGVSTHKLERAIACRGCGKPTDKLFQRIDGNKVGIPVCRVCDEKGV